MERVFPKDLERLQQRWAESRARGEELVHELRVAGTDGRVRWIEGAGRPLVDAWGEIRGYVGTLTDVTARRHAELERRRIATEIHDDPVQAMTAVEMRLESLRRRLEGAEAETLDEVTVAVQEALANVRRHSQAGWVHVTLADRQEGALLRVRDDGIGFDPGAVDEERPGHLGLVSMRERAETAGGRFRVASADGRGTLVEAWVPLSLEAVGGGPCPTSGPGGGRARPQ